MARPYAGEMACEFGGNETTRAGGLRSTHTCTYMASVGDVAAFIEDQLGRQSELKIQKLVYYAQAWSLAWTGRPLFHQVIKAWTDGPVSPELWHERKSGQRGNGKALAPDEAAIASAVVAFYGAFKAQMMIDLSHRELPWRQARRGCKSGERSKAPVSHESMTAYYGPLAALAAPGERAIPASVARGVAMLLSTPEASLADVDLPSGDSGERLLAWLETGAGDPCLDS